MQGNIIQKNSVIMYIYIYTNSNMKNFCGFNDADER